MWKLKIADVEIVSGYFPVDEATVSARPARLISVGVVFLGSFFLVWFFLAWIGANGDRAVLLNQSLLTGCNICAKVAWDTRAPNSGN